MSKDSVLTLRVETDLLERLRALARQADVGVSDLIRAAAKRLVQPDDDLPRDPIGYQCQHVTITAAGLRPPVQACCRMKPIYPIS